MTDRMDDRTLLTRAARAAGVVLAEWVEPQAPYAGGFFLQGNSFDLWNPLTYDADAFRLAVKLNLFDSPVFRHFLALERFGGQEYDDGRAHRRAFTRAAAELAKEPS